VLLDLLALRPWWFRHCASWVAVPAPDTTALLKDERVYWQPEQSARRPLAMLTAVVRALRILRVEHPDVIVSSGSGVAVAVFIAARLLGVPTLWLETLNIVNRPGIASRVCGKLAAVVLVQRPALLASRRRAVLVGELY